MKFIADYSVEANGFIVVYMANYYWKVRKDLSMARSVLTSNKDRCQKSLPFWKFFMNFLYSTAEHPADELLALRGDCMASSLDYAAKLEMYQLFLQYYATICEDVANIKQMKLDYSLWKLAVSAEQHAEEQRASQKRPSEDVAQNTQTQTAAQPQPMVQQQHQQQTMMQQAQQPMMQQAQPMMQMGIFSSTTKGQEGREITADDIQQYASQTRGEDGNTLFRAIADSDLEHAEAIMASILSSDASAPVRAVSVLASRFRMLESFERARKAGHHDERAFEEADCLSPYPSPYPTKGIRKSEWQLFRKAAAAYPLEDTERIILYLGKMDSSVKNAPSEWQPIILSTLVATIIHFKGRETGIAVNPSPLMDSL